MSLTLILVSGGGTWLSEQGKKSLEWLIEMRREDIDGLGGEGHYWITDLIELGVGRAISWLD